MATIVTKFSDYVINSVEYFISQIETEMSYRDIPGLTSNEAGTRSTIEIINVKAAVQEDWSSEYLDYIISVKVVGSVDEAIEHINKYGSGHTDSIVTANKETACIFMNLVDSADVFWNASTRFSDGFRYGFGAEVGISTNKIHVRGPVGLEGLLIYKWKLIGSGHVVRDYVGPNGRKFTHRQLNKEPEL